MKFLIAGFGSIGRRHMRNLLTLGERDIIVYRTGRSTLPVDELENVRVMTDFDAALRERPDALIVANPTALHLDVTIPAARAGCHILMEKPVSHSLERLNDLRMALQSGGGRFLTGFQYRFHPGLRKVQELLQAGAVGRPVAAHVQWGEYLPGWHPWEDYRAAYASRSDLGGGVTLTLSHPLDYLRWLFGEVQSLWAFAGQFSDLEIAVDDVAEIGLRFEHGTVGGVHLNYVQRPGVHRMEVIGSEGTLLWDNADGAVKAYRAETSAWETYPAPESFERNTLFMDEMSHFLAVIRGEEYPLCTLEDGITALELALAVHESAASQRMIGF